MNKKEEFQYYVTRFLTNYMAGQRNLSSNTISSYADAFKLLLIWFESVSGIKAEKISLNDLTRNNIVQFLNWLEEARGISASSRNIRLAAIRSFIHYVQIEDPAHLHEYQKILAIKNKKCQSEEVEYLVVDQMRTLLDTPDASTKQGFRDKTMLTVLYDTAARVEELTSMKAENVRLSPPAAVKIIGKGNKARTVPLMGNTVGLLQKYIDENEFEKKKYCGQPYLFVNRSHRPLTKAGVSYIIDKYVETANKNGANISINVHPHVFRHSKAVHLLESGVELIYIRDFLGHSSVKTTEIYARVCTANKRAALEKAYEDVIDNSDTDWTDDSSLMSWLTDLSKRV